MEDTCFCAEPGPEPDIYAVKNRPVKRELVRQEQEEVNVTSLPMLENRPLYHRILWPLALFFSKTIKQTVVKEFPNSGKKFSFSIVYKTAMQHSKLKSITTTEIK